MPPTPNPYDQRIAELRAQIREREAAIRDLMRESPSAALSECDRVLAESRSLCPVCAEWIAKGSPPCPLDTDGDGNCPVHPGGCPK